MKMTNIYALHDKRDWSIVYIGKTDHPNKRFYAHQERYQNIPLSLSVLQTCAYSEWQKWERFWIGVCRSAGEPLLNIQSGGNAPVFTHGRSPLHCARISASRKGQKLRPMRPESKIKIGLASKGHPVLPETRDKIRKSLLGRKYDAVRCANMGIGRKAKSAARELR